MAINGHTDGVAVHNIVDGDLLDIWGTIRAAGSGSW